MRKSFITILFYIGMMWLWLFILFLSSKMVEYFKLEGTKEYFVIFGAGAFMSIIMNILQKWEKN